MDAVMPEHKDRQTLNVDLGELKAQAIEVAKIQGSRSVGAWVKEQVALALQEHRGRPVAASPVRVAANRRPGAEVVKFGGYLMVEQSEALRAAAAAAGLSQIEYVAAVAEGRLVAQRQQAMAELGALNQRLESLDLELRRLGHWLKEPEALAQAEKAAREVRAQARRAAQVLDEVSATRRTAARRSAA
jgi:hypothetical protein